MLHVATRFAQLADKRVCRVAFLFMLDERVGRIVTVQTSKKAVEAEIEVATINA